MKTTLANQKSSLNGQEKPTLNCLITPRNFILKATSAILSNSNVVNLIEFSSLPQHLTTEAVIQTRLSTFKWLCHKVMFLMTGAKKRVMFGRREGTSFNCNNSFVDYYKIVNQLKNAVKRKRLNLVTYVKTLTRSKKTMRILSLR